MKGKLIAITLGLSLVVTVLAAACSSQPTAVERVPSQGLPLDPNLGAQPETPFEPGPHEALEEPETTSQPLIRIE